MGFLSLQHILDSAIHLREPCHSSLRSAFRVWLPSGRLSPAESASALFRADSALGIYPSKLTLPTGIRCVSARKNPRTVYPTDIPIAARRKAGSVGRGFWASALSRDSCGQRGFSAVACRRLPWGFSPSGYCQWRSSPGFHPTSSHALHDDESAMIQRAGAPEFRSISTATHPALPRQAAAVG